MIESFVAVFLLLILFHSYIGVFTYLWYDRICLLQQKDYGYDDRLLSIGISGWESWQPMQLLKMELRGFKSFADKTTLTFDKGITAIVGPNGSGKSNISDAIRWVMGEQNVRQLRGQKSEDIIFSGTEKRRPQGAAEVSLYFDNSDHQLDVEFTEVVVTRRIFRSGESEFFINKRPCRLKDIHLLFADTGIGQDSMAVIGQNRVDRILNSKPEERRIIFEEVAGISRYKSRKQDGLRKIEETEHNLERIHDMMSVLEDQLEPMKEQAQRLQTFRELDGERLAYEGTLALQELRNAERLLSKAENNRITAQQERDTVTAKLEQAAALRKQLVTRMEKENSALQRLDEETLAVHNELDSMKSRHEAFSSRQQELAESFRQAGQDVQAAEKKEGQIKEQKTAYTSQLEGKKQERDAARQGLSLTEELFRQAGEKACKTADALAQVQTESARRQQDVFVLTRDMEDLRRRLEENRSQAGGLEQAKTDQEQAASRMAGAVQQVRDDLEQARQQFQSSSALCKTWEAKQQEANEQLRKAEQVYRSLQGKTAALSQRIRVLESMEQEHEGLGRAVKAVLLAQLPWRPRICGVVGELCTIPAAYATALDIALGGASQHVVTDDERTARQAISYLKERHAGRTTFLPLDTVRPRSRTRDEEAASAMAGIIGFADDLIQYDDKYKPVFSSLLHKTLVAETADAASAAARAYQHRLRIVCLDGTLFNAGGSLTGGSVKNREGSLISRRAALQDLKQEAAAAEKKLQELVQRGNDLRRAAGEADKAASRQQQTCRQADMEQQKLQLSLQSMEREEQQARERAREAGQTLQKLYAARSDIQAELVQKEETYADWMDEKPADTKVLEEEQQRAQDELEQCRHALTDRQVALATLEEQIRHLEEQIRQHEELSRQAADASKEAADRLASIGRRQDETRQLLQDLTTHIREKEKETKAKDEKKKAFYASREADFEKSRELEQQINDFRDEQEQWNQRVHAAEVQQEKYRGEIERGEEHLARQGLSREEAMKRRREGSLRELNERVSRLRQQIAGLGQINPNADTEYQNAVDKRDFYHRQCEDLLESRKRLQIVVAEIDQAMSSQFSQAFAEIARHFQRIFSQLFGGGTAHISLTGSQDVLQSGVSILIQPPGKKQQPLTLLSGGERALTVIALLLAFLAYHPAPFVLFDEVDAALDEANVIRMARYMKNYSGTTQFIVITHRRKTMEAANTLQGVTMEEKGVSRLLTVKVDDMIEKGS